MGYHSVDKFGSSVDLVGVSRLDYLAHLKLQNKPIPDDRALGEMFAVQVTSGCPGCGARPAYGNEDLCWAILFSMGKVRITLMHDAKICRDRMSDKAREIIVETWVASELDSASVSIEQGAESAVLVSGT